MSRDGHARQSLVRRIEDERSTQHGAPPCGPRVPSRQAESGPEGRQALATALFAKIEVEGYRRITYELTSDTVELGLSATLPAVLETGGQIGEFGRGERGSASLTHLSVRPRFVLENVTGKRSVRPDAYRKAS